MTDHNDPLFDDDLDKAKADESLRHLLNQVERDVVGWKPNPGDKVFGTLVDASEGESEYGTYPLLVIETPTGRLIGVHCFHQVIKKEVTRKLERGSLQVGDQIAVSYRGEGEAAGGKNAPNMYRISVHRPS